MKTEIEKLAKEASNANDSSDALRYSQAALNLAHVEATLENIKRETEK
jgi:hypothetical protein